MKKKSEELTKTLLPTGALLGELNVMELTTKFPVDKVKKVLICVERYPAVPKPITVEPICVARYVVETNVARLAVETRFARFAVETRLTRFAVEIKFTRFAVETRFARLAVETRFARLAVETRPAGSTVAVALDKYPTVPKPMTVLVRFAVSNAPIILVAWMEET